MTVERYIRYIVYTNICSLIYNILYIIDSRYYLYDIVYKESYSTSTSYIIVVMIYTIYIILYY